MSALDAAYAEAVVAGIVNTQPASRERLAAFANKTARAGAAERDLRDFRWQGKGEMVGATGFEPATPIPPE